MSKTLRLAVIGAASLLAGCENTPSAQIQTTAPSTFQAYYVGNLIVVEDSLHGVVCYEALAYGYVHGYSISCVKVR